MKTIQRSSERGQALVLIVLGMIVLLGFTALAIDGGMVYSDRRFAQNAADASSLAGGGEAALSLENSHVLSSNWSCANDAVIGAQSEARTAAVLRAADNDFTIDTVFNDSDDYHGVQTECVTTGGPLPDRHIDIIVRITMDTRTAFAHFVYRGPLRNKVEAITRIKPRRAVAFGNAVVALNPEPCSGQQNGTGFHGTSDVVVTGGGVFSNGCLRGDGNQTVQVDGGGVTYVSEYNGGGNFTPAPAQIPEKIESDEYMIDTPDCGHIDAHTWGASQFEAQSSLAAGLHCVYQDHKQNVSFNGGTLIGNEVTIVFVDINALTINGNVLVTLSAPTATDPSPAVKGLLIYVPPSNAMTINLNGNAGSTFVGTILAPASDISAEGTNDFAAFESQIIAWNVEVGGTAGGQVVFNEAKQMTLPTTLDLYK